MHPRREKAGGYRLANPQCSGLLTSRHRRELNLCAYKKLWVIGLVNARLAALHRRSVIYSYWRWKKDVAPSARNPT